MKELGDEREKPSIFAIALDEPIMKTADAIVAKGVIGLPIIVPLRREYALNPHVSASEYADVIGVIPYDQVIIPRDRSTFGDLGGMIPELGGFQRVGSRDKIDPKRLGNSLIGDVSFVDVQAI